MSLSFCHFVLFSKRFLCCVPTLAVTCHFSQILSCPCRWMLDDDFSSSDKLILQESADNNHKRHSPPNVPLTSLTLKKKCETISNGTQKYSAELGQGRIVGNTSEPIFNYLPFKLLGALTSLKFPIGSTVLKDRSCSSRVSAPPWHTAVYFWSCAEVAV